MAISAPGLGSNLDVDGIVSQLMALERRPLTSLARQEAAHQAKLSAYGSIKGAISSFQTAMSSLAASGKFTGYTATSSSATAVGSAVSGAPVAGSYALEVTTLARAQKLVAAGQASETAAIGTGAVTTLTFDFGTIGGGAFDADTGRYTGATFESSGLGTKTVTVSSDNTLAGLRDAINAAKIGVTASIVNDGGASPYRLVLTGERTGAASSLKITVDGDAEIASLLGHDPAGVQSLAESVTAKNAAFKLDGITVSKDTNTVTDVIPGVTLSLLQTTASSPVTVTVAQDASQIVSSVNAFVKAYNDLNKTLNDAASFNAATRQAGILNGDGTVRSLQMQMRSSLSAALTGVPGGYTVLSQIGVAFQKDGSLAADSAKLEAAIKANAASVAALFAQTGTTTDAAVRYSTATAATRPGSYALTVDAMATQGTLAGSAPAGLTITAGVNNIVELKVNGTAVSVALPAGTYTAASLAAQLQSTLNGTAELSAAGHAVTVSESGGVLTLRSNQYGSASTVQITGGNGAVSLLGAAPEATSGVDVSGTINGQSATGSGQTLTGASGNDAEGLMITVAAGAPGNRGTVHYSTGYAYRLHALAGGFLNADGAVASRTEGIKRSIDDIGDRREALERRMEAIEKRYRAQFTALDTMMSSMTKTSSYLQQQLANLPKIE